MRLVSRWCGVSGTRTANQLDGRTVAIPAWPLTETRLAALTRCTLVLRACVMLCCFALVLQGGAAARYRDAVQVGHVGGVDEPAHAALHDHHGAAGHAGDRALEVAAHMCRRASAPASHRLVRKKPQQRRERRNTDAILVSLTVDATRWRFPAARRSLASASSTATTWMARRPSAPSASAYGATAPTTSCATRPAAPASWAPG